MKSFKIINFLLVSIVLVSQSMAQLENATSKVTLGIDVLVNERLDLIKNKRIGLITNPSGVNGKLVPTIDVLNNIPDVKLVALFGPEHGIRGAESAGKSVEDAVDQKTGLPIYSLFGKTHTPQEEMLKNVDVLVFDIQDIGSRTYTYAWTMTNSMIAAKKYNKKFIVLDRPNPINGEIVEGNLVEPGMESGIGKYPVAYCHGMTLGELAQMANEEFGIHCDLTVVPMHGWQRWMTWKDTGLYWVPTSPHIPEPDTPWYYPTTGILGELRTINEGVGYTLPFKLIGSPQFSADTLAEELNCQKLPGVYFRPITYKPFYGMFTSDYCQGVQIIITDFKTYQPVNTGYYIMTAIEKLFPEAYDWDGKAKKSVRGFDLSNGTQKIRQQIQEHKTAQEIIQAWQPELEQFKQKRLKYLLY
jgi:uncharacterized protein YbbC (DUF1343 family)